MAFIETQKGNQIYVHGNVVILDRLSKTKVPRLLHPFFQHRFHQVTVNLASWQLESTLDELKQAQAEKDRGVLIKDFQGFRGETDIYVRGMFLSKKVPLYQFPKPGDTSPKIKVIIQGNLIYSGLTQFNQIQG